MFEDTDFAIDKESEAYQLLKPTEGRRRNDNQNESDNEENGDDLVSDKNEPNKNAVTEIKGRNFNSLFAGKEDGQSSDDDN